MGRAPCLLSAGGTGTKMSPSAPSSGASTSDGVATRAGVSAATCSRIATETICWMAPNRAGDNSSVEVFEEVLRRGGSVAGPTTLGNGGVDAKETGADPPLADVGGIPVTTYKA
ncbi:UNVERIFIED_CONTAM: hypothetical protein Slati_3358500 [Sesamum latifolium]|uniref:Uncharacterized protein n=1 Tax=Sesamum latifolium TaxID=2727402 RepID=A0AAW2UD56_9LAMI